MGHTKYIYDLIKHSCFCHNRTLSIDLLEDVVVCQCVSIIEKVFEMRVSQLGEKRKHNTVRISEGKM